MAKKEFAVLGLGRFGQSVAIALEQNGCQVLAVDSDEENVQSVAPFVTNAICADVSEKKIIDSLGIDGMDGVVVAIGGDLEASIFATILAKEAGAKLVVSKASNDTHAEVLRRVGADRVVFPEKEMGRRIGRNLSVGNLLELIEVSGKASMLEVPTPENWMGRSLAEIKPRDFGINVIAMKDKKDRLVLNIPPTKKFEGGETLVLIGENKDLERLMA